MPGRGVLLVLGPAVGLLLLPGLSWLELGTYSFLDICYGLRTFTYNLDRIIIEILLVKGRKSERTGKLQCFFRACHDAQILRMHDSYVFPVL